MSEEKLYVVKNDEGKYWDIGMPPWWDDKTGSVFKRIDLAFRWAKKYDGHVVTLIEEPKKVVLTKEQAEIVENAHEAIWPATCISGLEDSSEQRLLMKAYVNGFTVAKEEKYNVKVPYAVGSYFEKIDDKYCIAGDRSTVDLDKDPAQFTEAEIKHFGLQDCEKEEVADDGD